MRKKILIAILFIVVSIAITQYRKTNEVESNNIEVLPEKTEEVVKLDTNKHLTVKEILQIIPPKYGVNPKIAERVTFCESSHNPKAVNYNDGGVGKHSVGIWQFQKTTFDFYSKKMGEKLDYYSTYDTTKVASYMIANGQGNQWTCYRKLYNV